VLLGGKGGPAAAQYMLAGYSVFGVMGVALFGFGVTVAMDREQGLLTLKRAQPMPPGAYLVAKMAMAVLFGAIILVLLAALAVGVAGVKLSALQWLALVATCLVGVLPFSALGLWLGTLVSGRGAPALINLVYLPMAFLSGLWVPLTMLPGFLQTAAPAWPAYHLAQIAQKVVGVDAGRPLLLHVGVLVAITVVFFLLARRRLVR
jgi:ABC-2 type transport system permease protein